MRQVGCELKLRQARTPVQVQPQMRPAPWSAAGAPSLTPGPASRPLLLQRLAVRPLCLYLAPPPASWPLWRP